MLRKEDGLALYDKDDSTTLRLKANDFSHGVEWGCE